MEQSLENWSNYIDYKKQVDRWVRNGKKKAYLLSKGPLAFFENWFNTVKPNKFWLMKYDERNISNDEKLKDSDESIKNAEEFLNHSKRIFKRRTNYSICL